MRAGDLVAVAQILGVAVLAMSCGSRTPGDGLAGPEVVPPTPSDSEPLPAGDIGGAEHGGEPPRCAQSSAVPELTAMRLDGRLISVPAPNRETTQESPEFSSIRCSVAPGKIGRSVRMVERQFSGLSCLKKNCSAWVRGYCVQGAICGVLRLDFFCGYGHSPRMPVILEPGPVRDQCSFIVDLDSDNAYDCSAEGLGLVSRSICR